MYRVFNEFFNLLEILGQIFTIALNMLQNNFKINWKEIFIYFFWSKQVQPIDTYSHTSKFKEILSNRFQMHGSKLNL